VFEALNILKDDNPFFDVVMTGHSFGGALATLSATRYASLCSEIRVSAVTFGCPRVGSLPFRSFAHSLPNLSVFRMEDPVDSCVTLPEVGHSTKWTHLGHSIVLGSAATNSATNTSGHIIKLEGRAHRFDCTAAGMGGSSSSSSSKYFSSSRAHASLSKMTTTLTLAGVGKPPKSRKRMCDYLLAMDVCYRWPVTFYAKSDGITSELDQEERHVV
jgi:hypothetical protein